VRKGFWNDGCAENAVEVTDGKVPLDDSDEEVRFLSSYSSSTGVRWGHG